MVYYVSIILFFYCFDLFLTFLNIRSHSYSLDPAFSSYYSAEKYRDSQLYSRQKAIFSICKDTFMLVLLLGMLCLRGFEQLNLWILSLGYGDVISGVIFFLILGGVMMLLFLPFDWYFTFVIEEKFGFNQMNLRLFFMDLIKSTFLSLLFGIPVLALILWFFDTFAFGWLIACLFLLVFQVFMMIIFPAFIMPLFNRFEPISSKELKDALHLYAKGQSFPLQAVFEMDSSKRSSKSNAFFVGFGRTKRLVLFDQLIKQHSVSELVTIFAHEVGHYKHHHILKMLLFSLFSSLLMFYLLSLFLSYPFLILAAGISVPSVYMAFLLFGILFSPVSFILSTFSSILSRRYEYEADYYAVKTTGHLSDFIEALKKLTVHNLGHLTPHPWVVFFKYSHPPVLMRIAYLERMNDLL